MNFSSKNIVKLALMLALTVCIAFSLSSCMFEFSIEDLFGDVHNGDDLDDGGIIDGILNPGANTGNTNFYPGSGSASIENISAENRTLLSTVSIICDFDLSPSAGSGVIYSIDKQKGDAYIVTNYHVVYYDGIFDKCDIYLYGMEDDQYAIPATFVGGSLTNDIAVLKVTNSDVIKNSYAIAAPFADSEAVRVFDTSIVVGNPEGFGMSATKGIISVESESLEIDGADGRMIKLRVMRTDAAINLGNSGGGLYNDKGEIIGVVCAKRIGEDVDNFGYAIPSNLAKNLVDNIIDHCNGTTATKVMRPVIGINVVAASQGVIVNPETGEISQGHITSISSVTSDCIIADKVAKGDIINSITINGTKTVINRSYQVPDTMLSARVGNTVILNITRGTQSFDVLFTVTSDMLSPIT